MQYRIKHLVETRLVTTAAAYHEVQTLRQNAYAASQKNAPTLSFADTLAFGDAKVFGLYRGEALLGSFMVRIPQAASLLESVEGGLGHYPTTLPDKLDCIEVGKLCIDPAYRGTDLVKAIFEQVHRELVFAGRKSILICSEARYLKKYRTIGFKQTGLVHKVVRPGSNPLEILVSTQKVFGIYGLHVGPLRWNLFLSEVNREMVQRQQIKPSLPSLILWSFYSLFNPLTFLIENHRVSRRLTAK